MMHFELTVEAVEDRDGLYWYTLVHKYGGSVVSAGYSSSRDAIGAALGKDLGYEIAREIKRLEERAELCKEADNADS
jgi:hypothetical protein